MPSFGVTRRYGRRRAATSTDNIVILSDPYATAASPGAGNWGTTKTITFTRSDFVTKSYVVKYLIVSYSAADGSASPGNTRITVNGVANAARVMRETGGYDSFTWTVPAAQLVNGCTIKIEVQPAGSAATTKLHEVTAIVSSVI